jgi:hypothetical protein
MGLTRSGFQAAVNAIWGLTGLISVANRTVTTAGGTVTTVTGNVQGNVQGNVSGVSGNVTGNVLGSVTSVANPVSIASGSRTTVSRLYRATFTVPDGSTIGTDNLPFSFDPTRTRVRFLGCAGTPAYISLTGSTTVQVVKGTSTGASTVSYELEEYVN